PTPSHRSSKPRCACPLRPTAPRQSTLHSPAPDSSATSSSHPPIDCNRYHPTPTRSHRSSRSIRDFSPPQSADEGALLSPLTPYSAPTSCRSHPSLALPRSSTRPASNRQKSSRASSVSPLKHR